MGRAATPVSRSVALPVMGPHLDLACLTRQVPNELQYALLEFIAHLNVEDYEAIPQDFINLGFSPEACKTVD